MTSGKGEEALRELALRLLSPNRPEVSEDMSPQLFVERLPDNLPIKIPIPEGFTVVGGLSRANERLGGLETLVVLDAPVSTEQVRVAYRQLMDSTPGWSERTPPGRTDGGFVFGPRASALLFCEEESGSALVVSPQELPGTPITDVRLRLDTGPRTPCTRTQRGVVEQEWRIPKLAQPAGARVYPEAKSITRHPDFESSSLTVDANMWPAEIAAHYNTQLAAGGWTLTGEDLSSPQAWSSWEFSDEQGNRWIGVFAALELPEPPRRYFLRVLAYRRVEHR